MTGYVIALILGDMKRIKGTDQPRLPSEVALSAHQQTGGGKHGHQSRRQRSKAERKAARRELLRQDA